MGGALAGLQPRRTFPAGLYIETYNEILAARAGGIGDRPEITEALRFLDAAMMTGAGTAVENEARNRAELLGYLRDVLEVGGVGALYPRRSFPYPGDGSGGGVTTATRDALLSRFRNGPNPWVLPAPVPPPAPGTPMSLAPLPFSRSTALAPNAPMSGSENVGAADRRLSDTASVQVVSNVSANAANGAGMLRD